MPREPRTKQWDPDFGDPRPVDNVASGDRSDVGHLPPELAHVDCDHPRYCAETGGPVPGFGPDGPFVDVAGNRPQMTAHQLWELGHPGDETGLALMDAVYALQLTASHFNDPYLGYVESAARLLRLVAETKPIVRNRRF